MYHPYLRGKQYELILLRENAKLIKNASMAPIIEPVKKNLTALNKAIDELKKEYVPFILIINPSYGDFENNSLPIEEVISRTLADYNNFCIGYIVDANSKLIDVEDFLSRFTENQIAFIHNNYPKPKELANLINQYANIKKHIFLDDQILYRRQFNVEGIERVLVKDGFNRSKSNRDYGGDETFSELHLTYSDELGLDGFGDFLIVGDQYIEGGGPAYAVAIHLTYINDEDERMNICHFVSNNNDTPTNPAGKFSEALYKLVQRVEEDTQIYKGEAYRQYKKLYDEGHYPGLGIVKKLSMQHHIEVLADYFNGQ